MKPTISGAAPDFGTLDVPLLVVALPTSPSVTPELSAVDAATNGALGRAIMRRDFRGGRDETLHLAGGERGIQRILLVGMGPASDRPAVAATCRRHRRAAGVAARRRPPRVLRGTLTASEVEAAGVGLGIGAWDFKEMKTAPPADEQRAPLDEAVILAADADARTNGTRVAAALGEGLALARRLGMLPGNVCTPDYLADTARDIAKRLGMQTTVMGRAAMQEAKMGSFLAVAQGTTQEPRLIMLEYQKGVKGAKPIVLVGKGLCFDSGGISIKPAQGMEWMKFDMCGAAGVLGAMEAIGRLELPINVVGLIGSTTNMPSGEAMKPGDVVQASNGKFIEIINTDAEGRLVLADVLAFAKRMSPAAVIDAATLTGACVIALGHTATGVMGNNEPLVQEVLDAAKRAGEPGWPLPLWDEYKDLIKSDVADIKNSGGRPAGTITAALFLKEFADDYPWVHLDIAGTAYTESDLGTVPRGPTGVPVGTFVEFVRGRAR